VPVSVKTCPRCHTSFSAGAPPGLMPALRFQPTGSVVKPATLACAPLWRRFLALLIDLALLGAISTLAIAALPILGGLLAGWAYFTGFETSAWQGTPGKRLLQIKVVDVNGVPLRTGRSSLRFLCRFLSALPLGAGFLLALFTAHHQTLHDMLASTRVVMR